MRLIHPDILLPHLLPSLAVRTQSAHTHPHDILVQVRHAQISPEQISEEQVAVGRNLVALVI